MNRIEFIQADIRDVKAIQTALVGVEGIIHLAAIVGFPACDKDPQLSKEVNVKGIN